MYVFPSVQADGKAKSEVLCMCVLICACMCMQAARKAESEVEVLKVKIQDLERVERLARVDLEQVSKRVCNEMFTEFN